MGSREDLVIKCEKQSAYDNIIGYDRKMRDRINRMNDNQLRASLFKGQRCDICKMGCQWYEEFKRRGLQ